MHPSANMLVLIERLLKHNKEREHNKNKKQGKKEKTFIHIFKD